MELLCDVSNLDHYVDRYPRVCDDYGEKTLLLFRVGNGKLHGYVSHLMNTHVEEAAEIVGWTLRDHKVIVPEKAIEKALPQLRKHNFTVVVCRPGDNTPFDHVWTPLQSAADEDKDDCTEAGSPVLLCAWMETVRTTVLLGVASVHLHTGHTVLMQLEQDNACTAVTKHRLWDEWATFVAQEQPTTVLFLHSYRCPWFQELREQPLPSYTQVHVWCVNDPDREESTPIRLRMQRCEKQTYQRECLHTYFGTSNVSVLQHIHDRHVAVQALCFLLDYIKRCSPVATTLTLQDPQVSDGPHSVRLANHALRQLHMDTVISLLLTPCQSPMGKRQFRNELLHPTHDVTVLQRRYNCLDNWMHDRRIGVLPARSVMQWDCHRFERRLCARESTPVDMQRMYRVAHEARACYARLHPTTHHVACAWSDLDTHAQTWMQTLRNEVHNLFDTTTAEDKDKEDGEESHSHLLLRFTTTDSTTGHSWLTSLPDPPNSYREAHQRLWIWLQWLSSTFLHEPDATRVFSWHATEKQIRMSDTQYQYLVSRLPTQHTKVVVHAGLNVVCTIGVHTVQCKPVTKQTVVLLHTYGSELGELCAEQQRHWTTTLQHQVDNHVFPAWIRAITSWRYVVGFLSDMDVLCAKATLVDRYALCLPTLSEPTTGNRIQVTGLRHMMADQWCTRELYVTNDLTFTHDTPGMLLFGINAVGKSTLMRAVGIAVWLAQAGMYVPASTFAYVPVHALYTRIWSPDDMARGLSTFVVEMMELRELLTHGNTHSLVLGDEVCSGTEHDSAIAIMSATLRTLCERSCVYLFATHLHTLVPVNQDEPWWPRVQVYHLAVRYNVTTRQLTYERRLQPGPGSQRYGILVVQALDFPPAFVHSLSFVDKDNILDTRPSRYHSSKLTGGFCEHCHIRLSTEIHHIRPQHTATTHGHIVEPGLYGSIHHPSNLKSLCERCHAAIHNNTHPGNKKRKTEKDESMV